MHRKRIYFIYVVLFCMLLMYPKVLPKILQKHNININLNTDKDKEKEYLKADDFIINPNDEDELNKNIQDTNIINNKDDIKIVNNNINIKKDKDNIKPEFTTVDMSYFNDALFIGDSRTDEIKDYGNIKGADFFCATGLNVFKIFDKELDVKGKGKISLENLLKENKYGKVYLMLGINEIGSSFDKIMLHYNEIVKMIRQYQPDAILFIQANLNVTKNKALKDPEFSKEKVNELNNMMKQVAIKDKKGFYIDVNEVFDDDSGYLDSKLTGDNVHLYAKQYKRWVDFLLSKGILYNN